MKTKYLILPLVFFSFLLASAAAFAAPTIDGVMEVSNIYDITTDTEWNGHVVNEQGYSSGDDYDVEKLGLWIDDNMLYIGLQTDYHLDGGWANTDWDYRYDEYGNYTSQDNRYIDPGDFAFDFGGNGSYEAGLDFQIADNGAVSLTLFQIDNTNNWINPIDFPGSTPYSANPNNYLYYQTSGTSTGQFEATSVYSDDTDRLPGDVLEIAINLDTLSTELGDLFSKTNTDLGLHWTMECGNDELTINQSYDYISPHTTGGSPVPEPQTFLLFGIGLIGLGAWGRKKQKNENS